MPTDAEIPASALAAYAHPDDPEISAGGTLAGWAEAGVDVWVLITTRGDKGTQDPDANLEELAALRVEETAKAAALLGFAGHFLSATTTASCRTTRRFEVPSPATYASCDRRWCRAPIRRPCSLGIATTTITTTGSRAGRRSTPSRPPPAIRTTSPSISARA